MPRTVCLLLMVLLLVVGGCREEAAPSGNAALAATPMWVLDQITLGGVAHPVVSDRRATLKFTSTDIRGSTGCNSFGGDYTAKADGTIKLGMLTMTEMACPGTMEQEMRFTMALGRVTRYDVNATRLILSDGTADNELRYVPHRPVSLPLRGTMWRLQYFTESDADTHSATVALPDHPITFTSNDGKATGTGGCNRYHGGVTIDGDELMFELLGSTRKACAPAVNEQEQRYFATLQKMTRFTTNETTLTLTNTDGTLGLQFRGVDAEDL